MAKQKAIVEETLPVEQVIVQQAPVVETEEAIEVGETIVEELEVEDAAIVEEVFETTPEAEQVVEEQVEEVIQQVVETNPAPVAPKAANEVGVVRIVQKTPSGFRLLLETGETVRVSKAQYTKGQSTVIL
jgi:D-ribose pyranose/furanose isomerase RbsD